VRDSLRQHARNRLLMGLAAIIAWAAFGANAAAQSIVATPNVRSAAMDEIVTINVVVTNPSQASTPEPPTSDDYQLNLRGRPQTNQHFELDFNGRKFSELSYTYQFVLTPQKTGILTIGPFVLKDNGRQLRTTPFRVKITEPTETKDLMVEVEAPRKTLFVGEAVELKLHILIRIYEQRGLGRADANYMLQRVQASASNFGMFSDIIRKPPSVKEVTKKNKQGKSIDYFRYTFTTIHYPSRPGKLDVGDIRIEALYPTLLRRTVFDWDHARQPRRLQAKPDAKDIMVKAVPLAGRPPYYRNAIGQFTMQASAAPRSAAVGDPITLNLRLAGKSPLDGIAAPKLSEVTALTDNFEISDDSLAGVVNRNLKTFSMTIRPRHEEVKEIPALPFAYFDPVREQYDTVWTDPIPLAVRPAERIAVPVNPEGPGDANGPTELTQVEDGLLANRTNIDRLLVSQGIAITTLDRVLLAACPLLFLGIVVFIRARSGNEGGEERKRRSRALQEAERELAADRSAAGALRAMLGFVADVAGAPRAAVARGDALTLLRERKVPADVVGRFDEIVTHLEAAQYAGGTTESSFNIGAVRNNLKAIDRAVSKK